MRTPCEHDRVVALFESGKTTERSRALAWAYVDPHADELFARMLDGSTENMREAAMLAAHLGDLGGDAGVAALERAIQARGPDARRLRCAALLALAKRSGEQATPLLRAALDESPDRVVRLYAVIGLAGAGDGSAWDQVLDGLRATLEGPRKATRPSEVAVALAYLAQHVDDAGRREQFVEFVRTHWTAIDEEKWFKRYWTNARPDGPAAKAVPPPDVAAIRDWAREPLFRSLGAPPALGRWSLLRRRLRHVVTTLRHT